MRHSKHDIFGRIVVIILAVTVISLLILVYFSMNLNYRLRVYEQLNTTLHKLTASQKTTPLMKDLAITIDEPAISIESSIQKTVSITDLSNNDLGSGVLINPHFILTAHHILYGKTSFKISFQTKQAAQATLYTFDAKKDLALLHFVPETNKKPMRIAKSIPLIGEEIFAVQNNPPFDFTITKGIISAVRTNNEVTYFQVDVALNRGASGGPIFNSKGELVGIILAKLKKYEQVGLAIHIKEIKSFLDKI